MMEAEIPIPGYENYTITKCGQVYNKGRQLKPIQSEGKSARIKLRVNGKVIAITLSKLVAMAHVPNPDNHTHIILVDRDKNNWHADNIRWVSLSESIRYNQGRISIGELAEQLSSFEEDKDMQTSQPIPGFENYRITSNGKVYCGQRRLHTLQGTGNRAARVKLKDSKGNIIRITVAKLVALTFIPNPQNLPKVIFKDKDKSNCNVDNIQWVSCPEFTRFVNGYADADNLLGPARPKREPDWIDPDRIPIIGIPGYYITEEGVIYKGDRIIKPIRKCDKSLKVRIWHEGRHWYFGLGKLVAEHFVDNPRHYSHIIFKDRDNHNCRADNIAWVDGATFIYYSGIYKKGPKKIRLTRAEAIAVCKNIYLKRYYQSLDEYWLQECWLDLEKKITVTDWQQYRSECFLYFIDRARRFSITGNPLGLMLLYMKGVRRKVKEEISPQMPVSVVMKHDESLRILYKSN